MKELRSSRQPQIFRRNWFVRLLKQIRVTIYEWGTNEEREENVDKNSIVIGMVGFKVVSKTTTRSNVTVSDKFIISVAKGQTIKLSKKKTFSYKGSISGKAKAKDLGLELTMTKEYSTEGSWSGPPEESQYNSGEYRIKFFEDQGTYTGYQTFDGIPWSDLESGTWTEPSRYALYSRDSRQ